MRESCPAALTMSSLVFGGDSKTGRCAALRQAPRRCVISRASSVRYGKISIRVAGMSRSEMPRLNPYISRSWTPAPNEGRRQLLELNFFRFGIQVRSAALAFVVWGRRRRDNNGATARPPPPPRPVADSFDSDDLQFPRFCHSRVVLHILGVLSATHFDTPPSAPLPTTLLRFYP